MNEFKNLIFNISNQLRKNNECFTITYETKRCMKVLENMFSVQYADCPDGYVYDDNENLIYIYEHFEIDCSPHSKKGSKLRTSISTVKRETNQEMLNNESGEITHTVEQGYSYKKDDGTIVYEIGKNGDKYRDNYLNTFYALFDKHHDHLELYKKNCVEKLQINNPKFKIIFVIEDVTLGGTCLLNGKGCGDSVMPLISKQFQEKLFNSNVDYLIFYSLQFGHLSILDKKYLNTKNISESLDLKEKEFFVFPAMPNITFYTKIRLPE